MLLEKITIVDWRCFYGEQLIEFACGTDKNVTLIHAENGVGKTSLLNALLWCFYNKTTARFEKPDDILNHQAAREGRNIASIAVEFSHEDSLYEARRLFKRGSPSSAKTVIVTKIGKDGSQQSMRNDPNVFLNSVLPSEMAGHFLFDGEHAEALTVKSRTSNIASAIKDILGCTFVSQSIAALENIESGYRRKVSNSNTAGQAAELQADIDKLIPSVEKIRKGIVDLSAKIEAMEIQRDSVEISLSSFSNIKQAQKIKRDALSTIERERRYEKNAIAEQEQWPSHNSVYCLAQSLPPLISRPVQEHNAEVAKNTRFSKEIIIKILDLGECVCGTCVSKNSELQQHLHDQLETAETQELQRRLSKLLSLSRKLNGHPTTDSLNRYRKYSAQQQDHFNSIKNAEITLNEVTAALANADVDSIADLQKQSSDLYRDILRHQQLKGEATSRLHASEMKLQVSRDHLDNLNRNSGGSQRHFQNQQLTSLLITSLKTKLNEELDSARKLINMLVKEIIEKTARKNFKVTIDQNFTVKLKDQWGNEMAKSEGENQLLGLAFTGALAKFAKIRKNAKSKLLLPGTEAPLVLDAPFGKLDPVYKHATAEFLPAMASQVIVMVNKEQGSKKVLELIGDRIGFQYALVRHNTGPQNEKTTEKLNLNGKEIEITSFDSLFDGTAIELI
jgi:DNA sulfur modification protein DndD